MTEQRLEPSDRPVLVQREGRLVVLMPGHEAIELPEDLSVPPAAWQIAGQLDQIDPEARRALASRLRPLRRGEVRQDVERVTALVAAWAEEYPDAAGAVGVTWQQVGAGAESQTQYAASTGALELAVLIVVLLLLIALLWWLFGEKARDLIDAIWRLIEELEDALGGLT